MAQQTFKRYERKYIIDGEQMRKLLPAIDTYMQPDRYCIDGKTYAVYNVYFDNHDNAVIRHSLSKPYFKEKLRMRSYECDPTENDTVFLELKKKVGKIVSKRRAILTYAEAKAFLESGSYPEHCDFMQKQVLEEIQYFIRTNSVYPAVSIRYTRMAFFGRENSDFRLTLDSEIRARRETVSLGDGGRLLLEEGKYLMEIKIIGSMPLWLSSLLSELHIYSTSFSKYGTEYKTYISGMSGIPVISSAGEAGKRKLTGFAAS